MSALRETNESATVFKSALTRVPIQMLVTGFMGLSGTLPTQLAQLTNLVFLFAHHNSLTGTIPTEIAKLSRLTGLSIGERLAPLLPVKR